MYVLGINLLAVCLLALNYSQISLCPRTGLGTIELLYWLSRSVIIIFNTVYISKQTKLLQDPDFKIYGLKMLIGSYLFLFEIYTIIIPYYKLFKEGMTIQKRGPKTDPDILLKRYIDRYIKIKKDVEKKVAGTTTKRGSAPKSNNQRK